MRFLRVLINLRDLILVEDNFLKDMFFPLARLMSELTARKYYALQEKKVLFIVILKKITPSHGHNILSSFLTRFVLSFS